MPAPSVVVRKNAAAVVAHGTPPAFAKSFYIAELYKRADEIRRDGESIVSARARAMTEEVGGLLWKASQRADGPEIEHDAAEDDAARPKAFHEYGPAHARIEALARDHKLRHPAISMEQARSRVMNERRDLADKAKGEHFASIMGGGDAATKTRKSDDGDSDLSTDASEDFVSPPPVNGPAHAAMQALADAHQRANPEKSPSQAYASVYSDPMNAELRQRVVAEHVAPRLARDAADQDSEDDADDADREASRYPGQRDIRGPSPDGRAHLRTRTNGDLEKRVRFGKRDDSEFVETLPNGTRVLTAEATRLAKAAGERFERERRSA